MARLTEEERSFRKSGTGLPISKWWPFALIFICAALAGTDPVLLHNCLGIDTTPHYRGKAALFFLAAAVPCSPTLFFGGLWQWILFCGIWAPLPLAVINWRWSKRNGAYWAKVRARERELRKLRREAKVSAAKSDTIEAKSTDLGPPD
jgi:hypothetical protein